MSLSGNQQEKWPWQGEGGSYGGEGGYCRQLRGARLTHESQGSGTEKGVITKGVFPLQKFFGSLSISQQTGVYPYLLGAGSARPNPKMGARDAPFLINFRGNPGV